jgi:hypothetical protein
MNAANQKLSRIVLPLLAVLLAALPAGCSDDTTPGGDAGDDAGDTAEQGDVDDDGPSDGEPDGAPRVGCVRDPALIAERRACRVDDDCPCGAGCTLGECVASCTTDGDCAGGGWCDQFGACRAAADLSRVPALRPPAAGRIVAAAPVVRLADPATAQPLRLQVRDGATGPVRVTADEGLALLCAADGAPAAECRFEDAAASPELTVWVRPANPAAPVADEQVQVYYEDDIDTVSVTDEPAGGHEAPAADALTAGVFRGTAVLAAGGTSDSADDPGRTLGELGVPLRAQLFLSGTTGTLVLEDPLGVLSPAGTWIGRVAVTAPATGTVAFPALAYLDGSASDGAPVEVLVDAPEAVLTAAGESFSFELVTRFEGLLMGSRRPQGRWHVALTREGDLPSDARAPAVPADATAALSPVRGLSPTPWEGALGGAATPTPDSLLTLTAAERRALLAVYGRQGTGGSLEVCNLTTRVADSLAQLALRDAWGADSPYGTERRPPAELTRAGLAVVSRLASNLSAISTTLAVNATLRPSTTARVLPCQGAFASTTGVFSAACGADQSASLFLGAVDLCDAMAAAYGCEVVDAAAGTTMTVAANISYADAGGCVRGNPAVEIAGTVSRICRMPVTPPACAELALCYEPPATGSTRDTVASSYLADAAPLYVSGDLECGAGGRTAAIDADVNAELPAGDPARLNAQEVLELCDADLGVVRDGAAPTLAPYASGLRTVLSTSLCLDAPRVMWALGMATDSDRRRATDTQSPALPAGSTLGGRLLQRWILHHGFVAREAAEAERMAQVFRGGGMPGDPVLPEVEEVLDKSLAGWNLLLHPRFATALDRIPDAVLVDPDYRPAVTGVPVASQPHHEQTVALPVAILETLAAQLSLVEPRLERAALARDASALELLSRVLRYAAVLRPMAADLAERAREYAAANALPEPAWMARYEGAARGFGALVSRLVAFAQTVLDGANPLGIADEDLPLYFFGDETTATQRFSAISDFLIGTGPGSFSWAPTMVERAIAALEAARTAWFEKRERDVQLSQSSAELDGELRAIRLQFGNDLWDICGSPEALETVQLLEEWTSFDENTCFVRADSPLCGFDADAYASMLTVEQVQYHMCVVRELRRAAGYAVGFNRDELNELADRLPECATPSYPVACPDGARRCLECRTARGETMLAPVTPDTFRQIGGLQAVASRVLEDAQTYCQDQFPGVDTHLPGPDDVPNSPASRVECYSGSLGEAVFEVRAAAQDLEIARATLADFQERYDITMRGCFIQQLGATRLAEVQAQHDETISQFRTAKLTADIAAHTAAAVKDCCSLIDMEGNVATGGAKAIVGCAAAGVEAAATGLSDGMQFAMDQAQVAHQRTMTAIQAEITDEKCFNDAELQLVGAKTATLQIGRALTDLESARYRFEQLKSTARGIYEDGRATLAAAMARYVPPLTHERWLDERINTFLRDLRLARRVVFLAVRAVEYETQQTLALSDVVLSASHPQQLQDALDELWATAATRGVGGRRPTDLKVVLSLRDQLLQLADRSGIPESEQRLTDVERFRLLLQSPRFAVHDADGSYLGQQIPFDISPLGAIELGRTDGVPILSGTDCAERVWSVNASILGADGLYQGSSPPTFTRIDLLKANTFYSQSCAAGDTAFQTASVRPSHNLFRDPVVGGDLGGTLGPSSASQLFTRARIEAYFNVDRAAFETDDYANGETSELAARGLYGGYALFLPADFLSVDGSTGLVLNAVDDILLRLDYVSVAR